MILELCVIILLSLATVANADGPSYIMELGGFFPRERSRSPPEALTHLTQPHQSQELHPITHNRAPCWTWIYTDHDKKKDFVCVVIPAISGKKAKFSISDDGLRINIKYEWPEVMFKADCLFSKSVSNGRKLAMTHPKVHAFVSHLIDCGVTEKSTLEAGITVELPRQVQRENDSWTMEKVVVSDTKIIILEFSAYQNSLIINDADTSLDF